MRLFKKFMWAGIMVCGLYASSASSQSLGASLTSVRRAYPGATARRVAGRDTLDLEDVDFAGVHWLHANFVFDPTGHLDHLSMNTASADYGAVLKLAQLQLNPLPSPNSMMAADEAVGGEMEIRVCESDDGQVTMTFEPVSTIS